MKGFAGMRGMFGAIAAAVTLGASRMMAAPKDSIMDRAPGFSGVMPKRMAIDSINSTMQRMHGAKECARRVSQMRRGIIPDPLFGYAHKQTT